MVVAVLYANFVRNMLKVNEIQVFYGYATKDKEIFPKEDAAVIRQSVAVKDQRLRPSLAPSRHQMLSV